MYINSLMGQQDNHSMYIRSVTGLLHFLCTKILELHKTPMLMLPQTMTKFTFSLSISLNSTDNSWLDWKYANA